MMHDNTEQKSFKTLRGFVNGNEADEEIYVNFSASLRIFGDIKDLDRVTQLLQIEPTTSHQKGERKGPDSAAYQHAMWVYQAPVSEEEPLSKHLEALWCVLQLRKDEILQLKKEFKVDIFCGYRSNCDHSGVELPSGSLEIFVQLQIPFGLSIVVI